MENDESKSADEVKLREWLSANDVYPGQEEMQSLMIVSFHSRSGDDHLTGRDEDQEWNQKISYALNNRERFLAYINQGRRYPDPETRANRKHQHHRFIRSMNYFLLAEAERPVIIHGPTGLKLHVYRLEQEDFQPQKDEVHIFGDDHGEWLAFETEGWNGVETTIFSYAVLWYAVYLDYSEMNTQAEDPRLAHRLRKI